MIRDATLNDMEALLTMAEQMVAESPNFEGPVDREWCATQFAWWIDSQEVEKNYPGDLPPRHYLRIVEAPSPTFHGGDLPGAPVGFVWGGVSSELHRPDHLRGWEHAVWIHQQHRGGMLLARMLNDFEGWARQQGAQRMILGDSTGLGLGKQAYPRLGYELFGTAWAKAL